MPPSSPSRSLCKAHYSRQLDKNTQLELPALPTLFSLPKSIFDCEGTGRAPVPKALYRIVAAVWIFFYPVCGLFSINVSHRIISELVLTYSVCADTNCFQYCTLLRRKRHYLGIHSRCGKRSIRFISGVKLVDLVPSELV